ncbi:metallophosphoesterase family protein [Rhizobium jaguaris]|uniref:Metallophosphoesterase n=1 Tax=Rhizobium jaguaris TaxID=1312183 RepID=A0A387G5T5_9HYPH|nr:metallophosphoesterase [Rhizobium jaguaris]AYG63634.1 metallophosphoesterase [Rhizobium jaguaris]
MTTLIDPRMGDVEADASSTKRRSLLSLAGSLLAEISLPKLILVWFVLIAVPALLLGLAPLVGTAWLAQFSRRLASSYRGVWPFVILVIVAVIGWLGGRPLQRAAEQGFWSLNSLAIQPGYALYREGVRHFLEAMFERRLNEKRRARLRGVSAAVAGLLLCLSSLAVIAVAWPYSRWTGQLSDLTAPLSLVVPTLTNAVIILCIYCAGAALVWGLADATMDQPQGITDFSHPSELTRKWRVAHLSDIHVVGERYGFRIESGRSGPRGNDRLAELFTKLSAIDSENRLDHILITGDITDAGRSPEWAEFSTALSPYPELAQRVLLLPGNHDINVVDRANPARLDLPISPARRLREMRALSGMAAVQANKVHVVDHSTWEFGATLAHALAPYGADIATFADSGGFRLAASLATVWTEIFPMILPPDGEDGLGIILLDSTAQTHFSFTNALGLISSEQSRAIKAAVQRFPRASWIVALHHHLVEYPTLSKKFSERIGTALINGSWFVRQLQQLNDSIIVMHGHRHIDWIGHCGKLKIISAPSPVMGNTGEDVTHFHIHTLGIDRDGALVMLPPERVDVPGSVLSA